MAARRQQRKIICGACGERVLEERARDAYRTIDHGGFMRFARSAVPGSTLTALCPQCYHEWDVDATMEQSGS